MPSEFSTKSWRKRFTFLIVMFRLIFCLWSSCVFSCVPDDMFKLFLVPPSFRKTFGWKSLTINLVGYLLFVFPLTGLAVYSRANERLLCGVNETIPRKVTIFVVFFCAHVFPLLNPDWPIQVSGELSVRKVKHSGQNFSSDALFLKY